MRLLLWCTCWTLSLHAAAQGGGLAVLRTQGPGTQTPGRPGPAEEGAAGGGGGRLGGRRATEIGHQVCAGRCCVFWMTSPKPKRCIKARFPPRCRVDALCRPSNRCLCRFKGYRCKTPIQPYPSTKPPHLDHAPTYSPPEPGPGPATGPPHSLTRVQVPGSGHFKSKTQEVVQTEDRGHISKVFLIKDQNWGSLKCPQGGPGGRGGGPESQAAENLTENTNLEKTEDKRRTRQSDLDPEGLSLQLNPGPGLSLESDPERADDVRGEKKEKQEELKTRGKKLSLREAQAVLMKTLSRGERGDKMAALLMKHMEKERKKLLALTSSSSSSTSSSSSSSSSSSVKTSVRTFHTQRGQYSVFFTSRPAGALMAGGAGEGAGGTGGVERVQVMFTPTICKVRCSQERCVNYCERGNVTTLYSSSGEAAGGAEGDAGGGGRRDGSHGPGFRVFLCPLLCKNGGVCLQKDRCLCPPNFTGKFCQIPVAGSASSATSANEIVKPPLLSANQGLTQSEFLLPLIQNREGETNGDPVTPPMVKVWVQHPPEASVKIHQVLKVSGFGPSLRTLSSSSSGAAGAPAPTGRLVQAQTMRGEGTFTQQSGFKYCFREVKNGQCSSPLPGLRSKEMCCRGVGKAWGITDCVLCPDYTGQNNSCPVGFVRNGTKCVDVDECVEPGLCENGICVNTRGSYSCVCRAGFILDASHGICISQSVISEEKNQCYRVLGSGLGPGSCSLPILRNITRQICCCSRVGKAWGPSCHRCPFFGSAAFKEICPAGPGYHYSASAVQFNQKVSEQLGDRGAALVTPGNQDHGPGPAPGSAQRPLSSGASSSSSSTHTRLALPQPRPRPVPQPQPQPGSSGTTLDRPQNPSRTWTQQNRPDPAAPSLTSQQRPQPPFAGTQGGRSASRGDSLPSPVQTQSPEHGSRPGAVPSTTRPARVQTIPGMCESRPGVCGAGRCVDQPGGRHTCVCDQGYQLNSQLTVCTDMNECAQSPSVCAVGQCVNTMGSYRCVCPSGYRSSNSQETGCHDIDECQQNHCSNGRCDNTPGSYRCVCSLGYKLSGHTCTDVDECDDALQCPGQECINSQGSYRCLSCRHGYRLLNRICTDVDECRQAPCINGRCENTPGSYHCVCRHGYKLQNNTCADVDECVQPSQCPGQKCVNTVGSYRCVSCRPGYKLVNRQCEDVDECVQPSQCPSQQCVNTVGSYRCVSCQPGYSSKNGSCHDVNECLSVGVCEAERVCVNTLGSFRCDCAPGYRTAGLGRQCTDINECLEGDYCFPRGECVNSLGSYTCVCSHGYTLNDNRTSCIDVDECVRFGVCVDGHCVNTEGSYHCQCKTGFTSNPERTACLDVDECVSSGSSVCGTQRCDNTIGSFHCYTSCEPGFTITASGSCEDVNECANQSVCGEHAFCQNLVGTYLCVCDQGFTFTADRKTCVDEDECVTLASVCGSARCDNVEGSFMCECDRPGEEFDATSRRCVATAAPDGILPRYNPSSSSPSSFHVSVVELAPVLPPLPAARPGEQRECYYNLAEQGTCSLLATNSSQQECCCTVGEGWGLGCQYHACPPSNTAEFLSLCPSGQGYITHITHGGGAFSYRDVDECKRFQPEVCKNGVCVNNIPGYNCYCSSGYVYNNTLLECVDHDECEEESCVGGVCVNTVGSFYCSCPHPLVLGDTQRTCVNSSHLTVDENLSLCWQHVTEDLMCQSPLHGAQFTFMDCCCLYGAGWGMECALCPTINSDDYNSLCSSVQFPEGYPDPARPEQGLRPGPGPGGAGGVSPPYFSPYSPDSFPPPVVPGRDFAPDYDDYSPAGGRSGFIYRHPDYSTGFFPEGFSPPDSAPPRMPSLRLPPDPRQERAFGARPPPPPPPPPSRPEGSLLNLAPLPGGPYPGRGREDEEEKEEEVWRSGPPFPPFTDRRGGGGRGGVGSPRRVYERRYESYAGLSTAEDCGILHGCENGRCIRVAEGYTCDCYQGYELDMTTMTCVDVNECEDLVSPQFPCVNSRCVNTEGSFRCVCRRGYIMSRRPNHCVAA